MAGPEVQLFVTCLVDSLAPEVGRAALGALERLGCDVGFPLEQGCCGQPALNVGLVDDARLMAGQTLDVLDATEGDVVIPSGSCTAMITHQYERMFAGTEREEQAHRVASRVYELTQFIVDVSEAEPELSCGGCTVAYHYSCHGLRELGLSIQADQLLEAIDRVDFRDDRECCGFGGLFSIEMPAVSEAIMNKKLDAIEASGAEVVVGGDVSCLLHIAGGLRRRGSQVQVKHIAELMAGAE